jgi:hypothetical protein
MSNIWETATEDQGWKNRAAVLTKDHYGQSIWSISFDEAIIKANKEANPDSIIEVKSSAELEAALNKKYQAPEGFALVHNNGNGTYTILAAPQVRTTDPELIKKGCKQFPKIQFAIHLKDTPPLPKPTPAQYLNCTVVDNEYVYVWPYGPNYPGQVQYNPELVQEILKTCKEHSEKVFKEGLVEPNVLLAFRDYLTRQVNNHLTRFSGALIKDARCKFSCSFTRTQIDYWADIEEILRWIEVCKVDCQVDKLLPLIEPFEPFLPGLLKLKVENKKAIAKWIKVALKQARKKNGRNKQ